MTQRNEPSEICLDADDRPFVFGVSGHRDLIAANLPELRTQLQIVFSRYRSAYPNASFELLSPLAEGADRVAAEVALADGIKLRVPMPMTQKEYERDFVRPGSLEEFRRLLAAAESHWEVLSNARPKISGSLENNARAERYAEVGDYIARQSNVLILFWDGCDNDKVGGTAWVKKRRDYWVKTAKERGLGPDKLGYVQTIQIVTPRMGAAQGAQVKIVGNLP